MSMGITQMNSLISSQNTLKSIATTSATRTSVMGTARTMASEIKQDKGRGMDTQEKEEKLGDMEERIQNIDEKTSSNLTNLNERIDADNEKIREEEATKAKEITKLEEAAATSKSSGGVANGTSAESSDTVNISMYAQNTAAFAPASVPEIPVAQAAQIGEIVDVKA